MSGCFGRWRGTRRSGRCKRVGQGREALSARSHRAPLTALGFTAAWRRKLAAPLALQRCGFEHSSPLLPAAAAAQQERSPNGALITLREPPSPGPKIEHRPKEKESEEWLSSEGRQQGRSIARATRGLRRPSLDARSLAQPCCLPEENHRPPEGERKKET